VLGLALELGLNYLFTQKNSRRLRVRGRKWGWIWRVSVRVGEVSGLGVVLGVGLVLVLRGGLVLVLGLALELGLNYLSMF
jgi:hypothetical protein